jgi:hypothetical protein
MAGVSVKHITDERGKKYGHPYDHFGRTVALLNVLGYCRRDTNGNILPLTHIDWPQIMICDKMARAAESPTFKDHRDDIGGYAWTWDAVMERIQEMNALEDTPF